MAAKSKLKFGSSITTKPKLPPPTCETCKRNITAIKFPGLSCYLCSSFYHIACTELTDICVDSLSKSGASWACKDCSRKKKGRRSVIILSGDTTPSTSKKTPSPGPLSSRSRLSFMDQSSSRLALNSSLQPCSSDLAVELSNLKASFAAFEESIKFFTAKFEEIEKKIFDLESASSGADRTTVRGNLFENPAEPPLSDKLNRLEQVSHNRELLLCGIPALESDDFTTVDLAVDFFKHCGFDSVSQADIVSAKRIIPHLSHKSPQAPTTSKQNHKPHKILIQFYSQQQRDSVKKSVRSFKKTSRTTTFKVHKVDFYVADFLTQYYNQLFLGAKDFVKDNKYHSVWVCNGTILMKQTAASAPLIINNYNDLTTFNSNSNL